MAGFLSKEYKVDILSDILTDEASDFKLFLATAVASGASATSVWADITEATYSGYARILPSWPTPTLDGSNDASSAPTAAVFSHNGGGTGNTITHWGVMDNAETKLVYVEALTNPKTMAASGDSITLNVTAKLKQAS